ncbi:MAG TPA: hypothetical protein VNA25_07885, partial [Phycisphaerae bacterium]|nr:hypothetical protein [Phycisphaerae bacterium]
MPGLQRIDLTVFGGLRVDAAPEANSPFTASDLANVDISATQRQVQGSPGASPIATGAQASTATGSNVIDGIHDYRKKVDESHEVLVLCGGDFYKAATSAYTEIKDAADVSLNATAGNPMVALTMHEKVFCVNGADQPWYYDGDNWARWSQTPPEYGVVGTGTTVYPFAAVSGSASTAPLNVGEHEIFFTFYSSANVQESPPSSIMRYIVPEASTANIKKINVTTGYSVTGSANASHAVPAFADSIRYWMTQANNPCAFYLVSSGAVGGASTTILSSALDITDASLTTTWDDFGGPPTKAGYIFKWGDDYSRIGVVGSPAYPSRFWWCNPAEPFFFEDDNFIDFG